jgi:D-alanyl-D-alanine carboxypeptidase
MKQVLLGLLYLVISLQIGYGQTTAYLLKYIPYNKPSQVVSQQYSDLPLAPASTLKLFTSWMSFNQGYATHDYLKEILMKSDNNKADSLFMLSGGGPVLKNYLIKNQHLEITENNFIVYDGSGLNKNNRTTCELQICLLERIYSDKFYNIFKTLMAQPGKPGTLEKRLLNHQGKVYAKTGTLNGTIALSGFYELNTGVALFSINSNNFKTTWEEERKRIDGILESLINQIPQEDSSKN